MTFYLDGEAKINSLSALEFGRVDEIGWSQWVVVMGWLSTSLGAVVEGGSGVAVKFVGDGVGGGLVTLMGAPLGR